MGVVEPAAHLHGDPPSASTSQAVADRRELAFVAMERTRMPMVITAPRLPDNPIVLANRAFLDETGYSSEEVIGRNCRFLQGPQTDRASVAKVRTAIRNEQEIDGAPYRLYRWFEPRLCAWHAARLHHRGRGGAKRRPGPARRAPASRAGGDCQASWRIVSSRRRACHRMAGRPYRPRITHPLDRERRAAAADRAIARVRPDDDRRDRSPSAARPHRLCLGRHRTCRHPRVSA